MDSQILPQRILIVGGVLLATFVLTIYSYTSHNQFLLVGVPAFAVLVFLLSKIRLSFALAIALSASALTLPGLPGKLNLYMLIAGITSVALTAGAIINKQSGPRQPANLWVLAFAGVMLFTASIRGFGLRTLGGESWGGYNYIAMFLACFFFLASNQIELPERTWRRTIFWMCLLTLLPTAAQAIYAYSGGALHHVFYFVVPEIQVLEFMQQRTAGSDLARLQQANVTSQYFFILAMLLSYQRRQRRWSLLLVGLALLFAGIAGNRISIVFIILLAGFYLLTDRRLTLPQVVFHPAVVASGFVMFILAWLAPFLPMTFQRVLSVIPFARVSWEAKSAAGSTIAWRFEVWRAALRQVPEYLLVGKGFAFSAQDLMTISARTMYMNDIDFVLASRNYHNGLVHALVDLGLPGLLVCLGFILTVTIRHYRFLRADWFNPTLRHYHHVFYAVFLTSAVVYFILAGGITHVALLFFWTILLEGFVRTDRTERARAAAAQAPAPPARRFQYA